MPPLRARQLVLAAALVALPASALCQPAPAAGPPPQTPAVAPVTAEAYVAVTTAQRVDWIVDGTIGPRSLFVTGPLAIAWEAGFNTPEEWGRGVLGNTKRFAEREADVAISNTIEGAVGALWGEEPRYVRSGRKGIWPRARYAIKTVVLAQRRDGRLAPAWGRLAGNVANNLIENTWLPPSVTSARKTVWRGGLGFLGRLGGNAWDEFWPDVARRLRRR